MSGLKQVCFSGLGGQGIVLAGLLFGEAAAMEGNFVSGSNSYGAQARGSQCRAEIVISDSPIDFPHLIHADFLISMSQGTYDLYSQGVPAGKGLIIFDEGLVKPRSELGIRQVGVRATEHSIKKIGDKQMANLVLLGGFVGISRLVTSASLRKAIELHIAERFRSAALQALRLGMTLGKGRHG
jgi:2-oxoglutarate ferredoxin oxidoreductase subunit gamma